MSTPLIDVSSKSVRTSLLVKTLAAITGTVPLAFGRVIVLSAVGSSTVSVVSKLSTVDPSKTTLPLKPTSPVNVPPLTSIFVLRSTDDH